MAYFPTSLPLITTIGQSNNTKVHNAAALVLFCALLEKCDAYIDKLIEAISLLKKAATITPIPIANINNEK